MIIFTFVPASSAVFYIVHLSQCNQGSLQPLSKCKISLQVVRNCRRITCLVGCFWAIILFQTEPQIVVKVTSLSFSGIWPISSQSRASELSWEWTYWKHKSFLFCILGWDGSSWATKTRERREIDIYKKIQGRKNDFVKIVFITEEIPNLSFSCRWAMWQALTCEAEMGVDGCFWA